MSKLLSYQTFASVSIETVPKTSFVVILMILTLVPMSNETVPKTRHLLFSFQQLTVNISSPIVVI